MYNQVTKNAGSDAATRNLRLTGRGCASTSQCMGDIRLSKKCWWRIEESTKFESKRRQTIWGTIPLEGLLGGHTEPGTPSKKQASMKAIKEPVDQGQIKLGKDNVAQQGGARLGDRVGARDDDGGGVGGGLGGGEGFEATVTRPQKFCARQELGTWRSAKRTSGWSTLSAVAEHRLVQYYPIPADGRALPCRTGWMSSLQSHQNTTSVSMRTYRAATHS
ncbi:hypothetical protein JB92DRAFT_2838902 [Gautieria morchelliformis]|nr:hypothetical protein JB92DRAFT_2838902 [Gautieria morchelliformis]